MNKVWTYISEEKVAKELIENKKNINENNNEKYDVPYFNLLVHFPPYENYFRKVARTL